MYCRKWELARVGNVRDFKTYVDQACRAAEEFVNIYYETMDKRRWALTRLYLDKATLICNGNVTGLEALIFLRYCLLVSSRSIC